MDKVIQGQTQSALVQKLSETEHNLKRFTHDIPDNAPSTGHKKVVVGPYTPSYDDPDSTVRFRIPRYGHLKRMYMRVRVRVENTPELAQTLQSGFLGNYYSTSFFGSFFESAKLEIGSSYAETMFVEDVLFNAYQSKGPETDSVLLGLRGLFSTEELTDEMLGLHTSASGPAADKHISFLIPLDFSIFKFHKDSPDTKFLERMELEFKKKRIHGYQQSYPASYTKCELVCYYSIYHEHFESQHRNANYSTETVSKITNLSYEVPQSSDKKTGSQSVPFFEAFSTDVSAGRMRSAPGYEDNKNTLDLGLGLNNNTAFNLFTTQGFIDVRIIKASGIKINTSMPFLRCTMPTSSRIAYDNVNNSTPGGYLGGIFYKSWDTATNMMFMDNVPSDFWDNIVDGETEVIFFKDTVPENSGLVPEGDSYTWKIQIDPVDNRYINLLNFTPVVGGPTFQGELELEYVSSYSAITFSEEAEYDLSQTNGFATDILITFVEDVVELNNNFGSYHDVPDEKEEIRFILTSNGKTLFDKRHYEIRDDYHNADSNEIPYQSVMSQSSKLFGLENNFILLDKTGGVSTPSELANGYDSIHNYRKGMYRIPLSMFSTEEFLNGGIDLKTFDLKLKIEGDFLDTTGYDPHLYKPRVVVRCKNITRIDGKTGRVV